MAKVSHGLGQMRLVGADELSTAMGLVPQVMRKEVLAKAVNKAGRVMVPVLRRATPKSKGKSGKQAAKNPSGTTRKSTGIVVRKYKGGSMASGYVGHRWPKGAAAHLVDQGTTDRFRKGVRRGYTGFVKGQGFFAPVVSQTKGAVQAKLKSELASGIEMAREKSSLKALKKHVNKVGR